MIRRFIQWLTRPAPVTVEDAQARALALARSIIGRVTI